VVVAYFKILFRDGSGLF